MMTKISLLLFLSILVLSSCEDNRSNNFDERNFSLKDKQVYAYTDINNPMQGYSLGDKEALDSSFAAYILNTTGNKNINYTDTEGNKLSAEEARNLLTQTRITLIPDPDDPEIMMEKKEEVKLKPKDIVQILCRENWYLNEEEFKLTKKVTHIAPVVYVYDHEGDVRGKKILYWIEVWEEGGKW